jgi:hypothetical protein
MSPGFELKTIQISHTSATHPVTVPPSAGFLFVLTNPPLNTDMPTNEINQIDESFFVSLMRLYCKR